MSISTNILVTVLVLGEFLLLCLAGIVVLSKKYKSLLQELKTFRRNSVAIEKQNDKDAGRQVLQDYLREQIVLTQQYLEKDGNLIKASDDDTDHANILTKRIAILQSEYQSLTDDPVQDTFWRNIFKRYDGFLVETAYTPELTPKDQPNPDLPVEAPENELAELDDMAIDEPVKKGYQIDLRSTAQEEIENLRSIISRQFGYIDELKQSLQQRSPTGADDSDLVNKITQQLDVFENEQKQLYQCIEVLEGENDRLQQLLIEAQAAKTEVDATQGNYSQENSPVEMEAITERISQQEELIADLTRINAGQIERISQLEQELAQLQAAAQETLSQQVPVEATDSASDGKDLDKDKLVRSLTRTNKEQLQCISILENELEQLQKTLQEKDVKLAEITSRLSESINRSEQRVHNNLSEHVEEAADKSGLSSADDNDIELLRSEYESMKKKFV